MIRRLTLIVLAVCTFTAAARAQAPQFRWRSGQVLTYRVAARHRGGRDAQRPDPQDDDQTRPRQEWQVTSVDRGRHRDAADDAHQPADGE